MGKITTHGKVFIDDLGRECIFNGINLCDKSPWSEDKVAHCENIDSAFLDELIRRGTNLIRLGFTWAVIEPKPCEYNDAFIDDIARILDLCEEKGIYAYIDMHQDLYSDFCCWGDGAPPWATLSDGLKPWKTKFVWAENYFIGRACHRAFDNFWGNKAYNGKGLLDYYAAMWAHVADRLKDKPALFGFDLLNEPFPGKDGGKVFRKLIASLVKVTLFDKQIERCKLIADALHVERRMKVLDQYGAEMFRKVTSSADSIIKKFDIERYSPFLNKTTAAIREVTGNGIVFIENCYYSNLGIPCSVPAITVNGEREKQQCFGPHGYDLMVDTPAYKYASNERVSVIFGEHKRTQDRLDVPVVVGEWGGFSEGTEWFPHIEFLLDTFDKNKWSNTYWAYFKGLLDLPLMDVLCRVYPRAVTGEIISYGLDRKSNVFTLKYNQEKDFDAPTEIFVPGDFKEIICSGEHSFESFGGKSGILKVHTGKGYNEIKIVF